MVEDDRPAAVIAQISTVTGKPQRANSCDRVLHHKINLFLPSWDVITWEAELPAKIHVSFRVSRQILETIEPGSWLL